MEEDPDIDIEENPILYPRIESIYSDANIKAEPMDIEEDGFATIEIEQSPSDYYMPIPNKIILGTKPSTVVQSEPTPGPSTASVNWEDQEDYFECTECSLIFPTQNELDSHKMTSHSFLVARPLSRAIKSERRISISSNSSRSFIEDTGSQDRAIKRQKAVKSTAKSALNKTYPILHNALKSNQSYGEINPVAVNQKKDAPDLGDRLLCKHCDVIFPDEIALIKHTYALLPETNIKCEICQMTFDSQPALRGHMAKHFKKSGEVPSKNSDMMIQCAYCSCYLMYPGFMKSHLLKNHKTTEYAVKHANFSGKCAICKQSIINYKRYNKHLLKCHRKVFMSKTPYRFDASPVKLKCMMCSQIFTSRYAAHKHKLEKHPELLQKQTFYTVNDKPVKELPTNATLPSPQILKAKPQAPKVVNKTFIPKQNLFKCNKCQIHFVSCSVAFAHSKRCSLAKGDWKCDKCRRTFTKTEKPLHMQQHQFSEKFKVHIVCDKIISKVLCRCPKCELLFDEISFADHVSMECVPKNGIDCKSCDLKIHLDSYAKHMRYHSKYNFSSADFIIIDFVDASFQNAAVKEIKTQQFKEKMWYCATCNCSFYKLKSKVKYHLERRCETLKTRCCTICGLTFSTKVYPKHIRSDHETLNLKLNDIKFVRIQDYKVINPVMPNMFQCNKCSVNFISLVHKNNHSCSKIVFEKCSKCSKKFDSASFDIHSTFHNYGRLKTEVKKAPLVQMKFYSCVACNYGFHSYDSLVEHCQNHFTNTEELATRPCKMCKLTYSEPHNTHSNRPHFQIFKFDHEKLLTDDWLTGFGSLTKDAVDDILSKCTYGTMRNIRLELLVEGPSERTIYKCAQCELNFDQDYIVDHTTESCSNSTRFPCSSCIAAFKTRLAKNNHMNVHVIYGDDITFREIVFNKENDMVLNEALRAGRQKESLKFRKCQQCELLIKTSDYQAHVTAHNKVEVEEDNAKDYKVEIKQYTFRNTNKCRTYKLFRPINAGRKIYTVYRCRNCEACIMRKVNMVRHKCGAAADRYEKCSKCSLCFLNSNIKKHKEQHALIPKFVPKNILVLEFQFMDNNKVVKKRRRYSSDDDASTGTGVTLTVSKTYDTRKVVGRPYTDNLSEDSQDINTDDSSVETATASNTYAKKYIKSCVERVDSDNESEASQNKVEYTSGKKTDLSDSTLDMERWRAEMKNKLYQCEKCYMYFSHRQLLLNHLLQCNDTSLSETPLTCDQCDMIFHPALISFHEKLHELVRRNPIENYFYLINISTNGVHTNNKQRWLHKCQPCDIYYLNIKSIERHYSLNHVVTDAVRCDICGLKFTKLSRTRHMRIQHEQGDWGKDDLHIEIAHKKIVGEGEVNLRAFVKPYFRTKECSIEIKPLVDNKSSNDPTEENDSMDIETTNETEQFKDDSEITTPKQIAKEQIDHNLYKCNTCSKHYLLKRTLERHAMEANHKMKPSECDICGLLFNKRTLKVHKLIQHNKLNLTREDFVITDQVITDQVITNQVIIDQEQDEVKEEVIDSKDLNESQASESEACDDSIDLNEEQNASLPDDLKEVTKQLKIDASGPINNHIYKCVECSVFYTNRRTLLLHIIIRKHQQSANHLRCDICGLVFGRGSLPKHKTVQHGQLKLTRKDFIITDVFGSRLPDDGDSVQSDIKYASSIDTDDLPLTELEDKELCSKETQEVTKEKENKIFKLYQCKDCKICVQRTERKLHVCCSDIQKKQCIKCCLYFRSTDVIQHKRLHRKYCELSRKNFVLIRFGCRTSKNHKIYKCVSCSTHFVNLNTLEWHMNTLNHQTKRDFCKNCGLFFGKYSLSRHIYIHHNKLNLTLEQFNIIYVSDKNLPEIEGKDTEAKNLNNSNTTAVSESETTNLKTVKKLFKCVECDVYFLTRASYYHHIYKHRKLDATEYIDCNICDFQFLNESLGVHMKSHKDKSFSLEKLLIEEYQPNADLPKIEFYNAKDNLNSKLVSTTTPFDNDDENVLSQTDEQLSVIDSTSDEMPKKAEEGVSVDNSLRNTESSLEERILDVVELPRSDVNVKLRD